MPTPHTYDLIVMQYLIEALLRCCETKSIGQT